VGFEAVADEAAEGLGDAIGGDGVHAGKIGTSMIGKSQVSDSAFRLLFGFRDVGSPEGTTWVRRV
jgi:hypothetical protein